jgi:hypothetical protein
MLKHQVAPKQAQIMDDQVWMDEKYKTLHDHDTHTLIYYNTKCNTCVTKLVVRYNYMLLYSLCRRRVLCVTILLMLIAVVVAVGVIVYFISITPTIHGNGMQKHVGSIKQ